MPYHMIHMVLIVHTDNMVHTDRSISQIINRFKRHHLLTAIETSECVESTVFFFVFTVDLGRTDSISKNRKSR